MEREERVASRAEVWDAIEKGYAEWEPALLRTARRLTAGNMPRARELVSSAVASVLEPDGRKWPIDRVPSLEKVLLLGIKSVWMNELAENRIVRFGADADRVPNSAFGIERMNAHALHDETLTAIIVRAREILADDECALAVLAVLEDEPRDDAVLEREAQQTGKDVSEVVELARRRLRRALVHAYAEVKKS